MREASRKISVDSEITIKMVVHQKASINRKEYPLAKHAKNFPPRIWFPAQILFAANLSCPKYIQMGGEVGGTRSTFLDPPMWK